jgi:hypothetical protein
MPLWLRTAILSATLTNGPSRCVRPIRWSIGCECDLQFGWSIGRCLQAGWLASNPVGCFAHNRLQFRFISYKEVGGVAFAPRLARFPRPAQAKVIVFKATWRLPPPNTRSHRPMADHFNWFRVWFLGCFAHRITSYDQRLINNRLHSP